MKEMHTKWGMQCTDNRDKNPSTATAVGEHATFRLKMYSHQYSYYYAHIVRIVAFVSVCVWHYVYIKRQMWKNVIRHKIVITRMRREKTTRNNYNIIIATTTTSAAAILPTILAEKSGHTHTYEPVRSRAHTRKALRLNWCLKREL